MARRFTFRLQPILKLREALEKEAQRQLARMLDFQQEVEARLEGLAQEREVVLDTRRSQPGQVLDLLSWKAAERYLVVLERRLVQAEAALAEAVRHVLDARQGLLRAHRDHLMLVRLKERKWEQYLVDTRHDEAKETDDITVLRFRRALKTPLAAS